MMIRLLPVACCLLLVAGCDVSVGDREALRSPARPSCPPERPCPYHTVSLVDLPKTLRQKNYSGGSCYHASIESAMIAQGFYAEALRYRHSYAHGASTQTIARNLDREGFRFAYTAAGDESFLRWCSDTRRWAAITYFANHAINFCGFVETRDGLQAKLLDNNRTERYIYVPEREFIKRWRGYGGGAITIVYDPIPPEPGPSCEPPAEPAAPTGGAWLVIGD